MWEVSRTSVEVKWKTSKVYAETSRTPQWFGRSTCGGEAPLVIHPEDGRFHTYIIGKKGSGKIHLVAQTHPPSHPSGPRDCHH